MSPPKPAPRRILLAVTGLTPQVVTETLYALAVRADPPWIPHEIHVLTTKAGFDNVRLNLLLGEGWFHRMRRDFDLPDIDFCAERISVIRDAHGKPLDDIRTPDDNRHAADFITEKVRELTSDPASELHVSIAGGRKTMGYYLGYALSLFGRPKDKLSHVLVSEPYETNRSFYYPTPYSHPIYFLRGGKEVAVDASQATVDLAEIPFVRLRDGLPERLRSGKAAFSQVVECASRGLQPARLVLDLRRHHVFADNERIALKPTEFLVLLWLAERARRGEAATDWTQDAAVDEYLALVGREAGQESREYLVANKVLIRNKGIAIRLGKYFEPHKSRINRALAEVLGDRHADRYQIRRSEENKARQFFLPLAADSIDICAGETGAELVAACAYARLVTKQEQA
ncbi:MAG: TIGR02584 family CRISPR-associated protein [Rhodocyclaceae bacterium]|nr:TIGR02584 family CRISPR-associated protein [Rhodocyclaceae bacterium]